MALAVAEAYRVLVPGGWLVGIHPDGLPPALEVWEPRAAAFGAGAPPPADRSPASFRRRPLGPLRAGPSVSDFIATHQALTASAAHSGARLQERFDYRYFFGSLDELTAYLEENDELELAGDDLLQRALAALGAARPGAELVLSQPVLVTAYQKKA